MPEYIDSILLMNELRLALFEQDNENWYEYEAHWNALRPASSTTPSHAIRDELIRYLANLSRRLSADVREFPGPECWYVLDKLLLDSARALGYRRPLSKTIFTHARFVERRWRKVKLSNLFESLAEKLSKLPKHLPSMLAHEIGLYFPGERVAVWDRGGHLRLKKGLIVKQGQDMTKVNDLRRIFALITQETEFASDEPWHRYYECIRNYTSKEFRQIVEKLKVRAIPRISYSDVLSQMYAVLGFAAIIDLRRQGSSRVSTKNVVEGVLPQLVRLGRPDLEAKVSKVIYPSTTVLSLKLERSRKLARDRQKKHRAKKDA